MSAANESEIRADERTRIVHEWLEATKREDDDTGPSRISQIAIRNLDDASHDELVAEIHRLDGRLRWLEEHYDSQTFVGLMAAKKIADQRDEALARIAQLEGVPS